MTGTAPRIAQLTRFDVKFLVFFAFLFAVLAGSFVSGVAAGWTTPPIPKPNYLATALQGGSSAYVILQKLKITAES